METTANMSEQRNPLLTATVNTLACNPSSSVDPEATICLFQAEIQRLQMENDALRQEYAVKEKKPRPLRIEEVQDNDDLIHLYTGFLNFQLLLAFFTFLGPAVNKLMYWGSKGTGKLVPKENKTRSPESAILGTHEAAEEPPCEGSCISLWNILHFSITILYYMDMLSISPS